MNISAELLEKAYQIGRSRGASLTHFDMFIARQSVLGGNQ